jgi:hypothetical protein
MSANVEFKIAAFDEAPSVYEEKIVSFTLTI